MNYRHAFHAGNFADVVKHLTLVLCAEHLKKKPAPFRIVDTHAGSGRYDLTSDAATRTGEWRDGIAQIFGPDAAPLPADVALILAPYFAIIAAENTAGKLTTYPGSPVIAQALLRKDDRLAVNELHADDAKALGKAMAGDKSVITTAVDGYIALKAALPPKERRGIVLVDPPFEEQGELIRLTEGLAEGLKRFATGTYILWYPIKDPKPVARFHRAIAAVTDAAKIEPALSVEVYLRPPRNPDLLNGAGLIVVNPPFTLEAHLKLVLDTLVRRFSTHPEASSVIEVVGRRTISAPSMPPPTGPKK